MALPVDGYDTPADSSRDCQAGCQDYAKPWVQVRKFRAMHDCELDHACDRKTPVFVQSQEVAVEISQTFARDRSDVPEE